MKFDETTMQFYDDDADERNTDGDADLDDDYCDDLVEVDLDVNCKL